MMKKELLEILKKVKRLEIKTRRLVNEVFSGEYHSIFKGRGMEFSEVREYSPGDDIRSIDWNVTARMGRPYVKKFMEERELNVLIMVDLSGSENFGSHDRFKDEAAAEIAAMLAFSALRNNDRVGLLVFTNEIEKYLPPKKGKQYGMRIIREILYCNPRERKTDLGKALAFVVKVLRRRSIIFLISDFMADSFEKPLRLAARKHDLVALEVYDQYEDRIPSVGLIHLEDAETGNCRLIDSRRASFLNVKESLQELFRAHRIDHVRIENHISYAEPLSKLFRLRERRLR